VIDEAQFEAKDWASRECGHLDGVEELPPNMPEPRGQGFVIRAKVDVHHASDSMSRRSRTGFLVWINSCLVSEWKPRIHNAPLTREPGKAVALGRVLVQTTPNFNDLFSITT
jgi:hypothetical protein